MIVLKPLLYAGGSMLATIPIAALLCHFQIAHRKRISFGTLIASSIIANTLFLAAEMVYEEGWLFFLPKAWTWIEVLGETQTFIMFATALVLCNLPALGVAVYHQKRNEIPVLSTRLSGVARNLHWNNPAVLWLASVIPFTAYGLLGPGLESGIFYPDDFAASVFFYPGGLGFSIGTCLAAGSFTFQRVRRRSLGKPLGILLLLGASALAALALPIAMGATGYYHGHNGLVVLGVAVITTWIGLIAFVVFGVWVLLIPRKRTNN